MSRVYRVVHRTEYEYDEPVTASYGRAYLLPRDLPGQWARLRRLTVSPEADLITESEDFYGNASAYVEVHTPHRRLVVTATSEAVVDRGTVPLSSIDTWSWERARDSLGDWPSPPDRPAAEVDASAGSPGAAGGPAAVLAGAAVPEIDQVSARGFLLPSPQVNPSPEIAAFAAASFPPGRGVAEAVRDLVSRIHDGFAYRPGTTSVATPLAEVLTRREGVCQDFAHLAVASLRWVGLPARYVSGYLETQPPPGRPKLVGADASHAWASVLLPELGWVDIDPTNDRIVDDDYVVTAWGRDYSDVPPLKGVIFTESTKSTLTVAVDVSRL